MAPTVSKVMIGDWLLVDGKVTKVTKENIDYVLNTLCQPLPLTPEFFEKNGWEHQKSDFYDGYYFVNEDLYEMHAHEFNDGMWQVEYDNIEMSGIPTMSVNVCWIHEVCRFLEFCSISGEMIKHVEYKGYV